MIQKIPVNQVNLKNREDNRKMRTKMARILFELVDFINNSVHFEKMSISRVERVSSISMTAQ
jgi:hypothetical protein